MSKNEAISYIEGVVIKYFKLNQSQEDKFHDDCWAEFDQILYDFADKEEE